MRLAGRCACGMVLEWVAREPDAHLACFGLRWCGRCGEAARFRENCPACHRRQSREHEARQRRQGTARYERDKARKRARYRTDPSHAEAKRAADRARTARRAA